MKGLAMKVGQILSYLDGLPAETQRVLAALQRGAASRPLTEIAAMVESELGAPLASLFDEFSETPVAAASIGQVHRAVVEGREVAVKVQYPDVAASFQSDTQRLRRLASLASLATNVDGQAIVDELAARLAEECDYRAELRNQTWFSQAFANDPEVVIPETLESHSATRVLTTAWEEARSFEAFCTSASATQRNAAAQTLVRFAWRSFFVHHALHADPHPGNFGFADTHVVFFDFGCVRRFDAAFVEAVRALFQCTLDEDRARFPEVLIRTGMVPEPSRYNFDAHWEQVRYELEPYRAPSFHFTPEYTARAAQFSRPTHPNSRRMAIPPPWIWLLRLQYGLPGMLRRLDAEGDFGAILQDVL